MDKSGNLSSNDLEYRMEIRPYKPFKEVEQKHSDLTHSACNVLKAWDYSKQGKLVTPRLPDVQPQADHNSPVRLTSIALSQNKLNYNATWTAVKT